MILTIDNQTLYIDGNSAGSLVDSLANFPSYSSELWSLLNEQNKAFKAANDTLLLEKTSFSSTIASMQANIDALQAENDLLRTPIAASYIELDKARFFIMLNNKFINGISLLTMVQTFIASRNSPDLTLFFENSPYFRNTDPMVRAVGILLGLTEADIDSYFQEYQNYTVVL